MGGLVRGLPVVGWHLTTAVASCRVQTFYRGQLDPLSRRQGRDYMVPYASYPGTHGARVI